MDAEKIYVEIAIRWTIALERQDWEKAQLILDQAIDEWPQDANDRDAVVSLFWTSKSITYAWATRHRESVSASIKAVRLAPKNSAAWKHASMALQRIGKQKWASRYAIIADQLQCDE